MVDYLQKRATADRMIREYGQESQLRRASGSRDCWALEVVLTSRDRQTLKNPTNRVFLVSPVDLAVPPDDKHDSLIWNDAGVERVLRQDAPVAPLAPGGVVIYYELQVKGPS
jgi:hypothetical protein